VLGASALSLALPGMAGAATTATTTPTTNAVSTSCSTSTTITVTASSTSSAPVTATLTSSCAFTPGSNVVLSAPYSTQTVTADATTGKLTLTFGATGVPTLSVNGGTFQSAVFGVNTITATGSNSTGGTNVATFLVDIEMPSATTTTVGSGTGASQLAFTGADLAALIAASLALILMGTAVVIYTRRRAEAAHKS
jgi:hypothetical protein